MSLPGADPAYLTRNIRSYTLENIIIDNEFKSLIPPLANDERKQLEQNIIKDGCRDALVVWNNILIDGHNRHEICAKNNIPFNTISMTFEDRESARVWIRNNQKGRRNLTPAWLIELELGNKEDLARIGAAKRVESGKETGRGNKKVLSQNDNTFIEPQKHNTQKEIAKKAGVSVGQVGMAEQVRKKSPEKWEKAKAGEVSISTAYKEIKKEENAQVKKARKIKEDAPSEETKPIIYCDNCMNLIGKIKPIDLLIADPPYFTDGNNTELVSSYLKMVKRTGQAYVFSSADPEEIAAYIAMNRHHMQLAQVLVWNYNNTGQIQPNKKYNSNYQIALYFRGPEAQDINKPSDGKHQYACQTINAPDARIGDRFHKWQKPIDLIERYIKNSSQPGDFVFDPFAGSGTTLIAASKLGRLAEGCDIDAEAVDICVERGCARGV